ncbi:MAG: bactofilin family protein [Armatimonadota bacterium]
MKLSSMLLITIIVCISCMVFPCYGIETRSDDNINIARGTNVTDDIAAFGQNISVDGTITGDLMAFGSNITVPGTVSEDLTAAGGMVTIAGSVGDDLRVAGGQVQISGPVRDNAALAGGTVNLESSGRVGKDLMVAAGNANINGVVTRNLSAASGNININGRIGGSARIHSDNIIIGQNAVITGDLVYTGSKRPQVAQGARIGGEIREVKARVVETRKEPASPFGLILFWLGRLLAMYLVGVLLIALAPRIVASTADRVIASPWISLLIGFIALIVVPALIAFIFITIIGIPLALILSAMYFIMLYISRIFVGVAVGRWITGRLGKPQMSQYLNLLIGLVILAIISAIPFLGGLISFVVLLLGLGALLYQRYVHMRELRATGHI